MLLFCKRINKRRKCCYAGRRETGHLTLQKPPTDRGEKRWPEALYNESEENVVLDEYRKHVAERAAQGIVAKPLDASQMAALVELLKNPDRKSVV